ncbi:prepilin peptidase [Clostridium sp. HBUAS56017]|uniref:prepilin peptidase n=1 Tax=Clostridium sp. HBUAS56017 TaxID=2571128 RepID=UPI001178C79D|nr:prepilin peptidase [Clostridium sp. HBUAS56017]
MVKNIIILIAVYFISFLTMYLCTFSIKYINKNDNQTIRNKITNKIFLSSISGALILLLYIKEGMGFEFLIYSTLIVFLVIIGYVDYETKYVYEIMSIPLLGVSVITSIMNLVIGNITYKEILGSLITIGVVIVFSKLNYVGAGDIEVLSSVFLILNKVAILPGIVLIFSFGISGIVSIYLLLIKKVDINYRKAFCPSIAIATYLLLLLI